METQAMDCFVSQFVKRVLVCMHWLILPPPPKCCPVPDPAVDPKICYQSIERYGAWGLPETPRSSKV